MTTQLHTAARMALDALETCTIDDNTGRCNGCGKQYDEPHHEPCKVNAAIAALREAFSQPAPEPVAWAMLRADGLVLDVICPDERDAYQGEYTVPLYAAPPIDGFGGNLDSAFDAAPVVLEPLTDEQVDALWRAPMSADWEHREFARAIEAAHGIGTTGGGK